MPPSNNFLIEGQLLTRCSEWPSVLTNDDGLRPTAGSPHACFYCQQSIGQKHGLECPCVSSLNLYEVWEGDEFRAEDRLVGIYVRDDPYFWDQHDCEFHKNESSWCVSNAVPHIFWLDPEARKRIEGRLIVADDALDRACVCQYLRFRFIKTLDKGPFVVTARPQEDED